MPLSHPPGHAQCDFGEALVIIGGVEQKAHCFVLDLPHSDGCFVKAYPAETTEAFLDGHVLGVRLPGRSAPEHPLRQYQAGRGEDTGGWTASASAPGPSPSCSRTTCSRTGSGVPGKGNDKGKVEGLVGLYAAKLSGASAHPSKAFDALNAYLERRCLERMDAQLEGPFTETIGQRMERDLDALLPLPPVAL